MLLIYPFPTPYLWNYMIGFDGFPIAERMPTPKENTLIRKRGGSIDTSECFLIADIFGLFFSAVVDNKCRPRPRSPSCSSMVNSA